MDPRGRLSITIVGIEIGRGTGIGIIMTAETIIAKTGATGIAKIDATGGIIAGTIIAAAIIDAMIAIVTIVGTVTMTDLISVDFLWTRACSFLSDGMIGGNPFSYRE